MLSHDISYRSMFQKQENDISYKKYVSNNDKKSCDRLHMNEADRNLRAFIFSSEMNSTEQWLLATKSRFTPKVPAQRTSPVRAESPMQSLPPSLHVNRV
jgi:hypothetical protein